MKSSQQIWNSISIQIMLILQQQGTQVYNFTICLFNHEEELTLKYSSLFSKDSYIQADLFPLVCGFFCLLSKCFTKSYLH